MVQVDKGRSPFYPGQPVPVELFVGRAAQIDRILTRGAGQVAAGKPVSFFVQGEYGIGKSSLAAYVRSVVAKGTGLYGIYATLGGVSKLEDIPAAVMQATVDAAALSPKRSEIIRSWLAKYIGKQELFGVSLDLKALEPELPTFTKPHGMLHFLADVRSRLQDVTGIFLILDEINGLTGDARFAHFMKGLVEANSMLPEPLPLLLMLCGVEERRREMIQAHPPVDRIFDVIEIEPLNETESRTFFRKAFESVQMSVDDDAMKLLTYYSAGFPKIMHLVGDTAFWMDRDGVVDQGDAVSALMQAAEDVGKKYVDQQVYNALHSKDYKAILKRIAEKPPREMSFSRADVKVGLTESQAGKLDNFLQRMKALKVLRAGDSRGQYVFNSRIVRLYIWLDSLKGGKARFGS
jgi:hypothetical protein